MWKVCICLIFALVSLLLASWFTIDWCDDGVEHYPGGTILWDNAGNVIRVTLGTDDTDCRPYYEASGDDWIVKALIAVEDGEFWSHHGVRPLSIVRAAMQNLCSRRRISGASTITMQAVRLIHPHPKTLWWKWKEAIMALKLERQHTKLWILTQYLNRAPYGSNFVGIEAGAQGWFGKHAKDLGIGEAALLAGMVQAPSRYRPDRGYDKAIVRRDYVLSRMRELNMITDEQFCDAKKVKPIVNRAPRPFKYPHFCDWVLANHGAARTALDADIQALCEQAVNTGAEDNRCASAAVVMEVRTGEVIAMACSGDYFSPNSGQFNTATAARPAGSTLKPFLTALALDRGIVAPETLLEDSPITYSQYHPANFDGKYRGLVTLKDALILSLNIPFVQILNFIGVKDFAENLRALGFRHLGDASKLGLGLAIGNGEVTLVELVSAYRRLAGGGERIFSPRACYQIAEMLSGEERSSAALGHNAAVRISRFAWKTGTSSAYRDAWTIAWNPQYVIGVWCGHLSGRFGDTAIVGAKAAAPIAWKIARQLYPQNDGPWFERPQGMVETPSVAPKRFRRTKAGKLMICKPEEGAKFELVEGITNQKLVCKAIGREVGTRIWWFMDNRMIGESDGESAITVDMEAGEHLITAATMDGESDAVHIKIAPFAVAIIPEF